MPSAEQRLDYLAACVHDGTCRRMSWTALRELYFRDGDDQAAARLLAAWADEHAIDLRTETERVGTGALVFPVTVVIFAPRQ